MKIRLGFVSNSSSSSFIIAVKSDISENEKKSLFKNYIEKHYKEACSQDFWWEDEDLPSEDKIICDIFKIRFGGNLELDDWIIYWGECGNEGSEDFLSYLFYCLPDINTPKFKFKTYC